MKDIRAAAQARILQNLRECDMLIPLRVTFCEKQTVTPMGKNNKCVSAQQISGKRRDITVNGQEAGKWNSIGA